jgi:hypothetical protein
MAVNPLDFVGKFDPAQPDIQKLHEGLQRLQNTGALQQAQDAAAGRRQAGVNEAGIQSSLIRQNVDPSGDRSKQLQAIRESGTFKTLAEAQNLIGRIGLGSAFPSGTPGKTMLGPSAPLMRQPATSTSAALAGRVTTATDKDTTRTTELGPGGKLGVHTKETTLQEKDKGARQGSTKDAVLRRELTAQAISILGLKSDEFEIVVYPGTSRLVIRNTVTNKYYAKP